MNPTMAKGDLAESSRRTWTYGFIQVGQGIPWRTGWIQLLLPPSNAEPSPQPYQNGRVSGLKVCQATMIAPGCSVYVLRGDRVYQLTPMSVEGEAMIETFALLP